MLQLHRAERADRLADALGGILAVPTSDPFAPEIVSVPTRGMERWLTQRLSGQLGTRGGRDGAGDGVCANVEFPFPGRLLGGALARASGIDPETDPWTSERMVWPLLAAIDGAIEEPWLRSLAGHLAANPERRLARVRQIAALLDQYAVRRPAMILEWAQGADAPGANAWQSELWRRLRARIGVPSGPERLEPASARLRGQPDVVELPARLALFGLTRLPPSYLEVLRALAAHREVHLLLLHPSPALWAAVAAEDEVTVGPRARDPTVRLAANRLLASWGRDSRELQVVLGRVAQDDHIADRRHALPSTEPATLLQTLQADVRANRAPPGPPLPGAPDTRRRLAPQDDSLRIHACHGRQRQVEVLREAILHRLAADPTLEPRDVIVMCPDIETFAPLIQASFGSPAAAAQETGEGLGEVAATDLRVRLADRSLRQTNPVLSVIARLLELPNSRLTASDVLDLADTEPVRRRFRLGDDDLARIQDWVAASGIHWGLDAPRRAAFMREAVPEGTWLAGLRRVLLGATMSDAAGRLFAGVLPVDDVDSGAIDLAGRFAELIDRLAVALGALAGPHTVSGWAGAIGDAAQALTATADRDAWQGYELRRLLADLVAEAGAAGARAHLALPEIRALIGDRLAGRPTRANFRTGHLTICTLVPMRSVPHRIVGLLGLDDGAFPRRIPRSGDDLLLEAPHIGDRDPRAEDRQLLLDALMAAGDALIVTYSGNDERTNAPLPPAVPIGELLDAVDATAVGSGPDGAPGEPAREQVLIAHPLQPFDPRNFEPGRLRPDGPWSFDPVALEGAQAIEGERVARPPFIGATLPPVASSTVALADLIAFVERPVRAFLRQRLGIATGSFDDEVTDVLPVELDALGEWGVGQRLLDGLLAGRPAQDCIRAEIARGTLPPGQLGPPVLERVRPGVAMIVRHVRALCGDVERRSLETNVELGSGVRLTGTVPGVRDRLLLSVSYSRLNARHRLAAWVRLLALSAAHPDVPFEAVTIGRAPRDDPAEITVARIPPLDGDPGRRGATALGLLGDLVDLRADGLREPLPVPCLTAAAFVALDETAAHDAWTSGFKLDRENREPEHMLVFGGELPWPELLARPLFAATARRLWTPLLSREEVEGR